jgi:hypothetical protein
MSELAIGPSRHTIPVRVGRRKSRAPRLNSVKRPVGRERVSCEYRAASCRSRGGIATEELETVTRQRSAPLLTTVRAQFIDSSLEPRLSDS